MQVLCVWMPEVGIWCQSVYLYEAGSLTEPKVHPSGSPGWPACIRGPMSASALLGLQTCNLPD